MNRGRGMTYFWLTSDLLLTDAHWFGSQKNGTLWNGLLLENSAVEQLIPTVRQHVPSLPPMVLGQVALQAAPLSAMALKWSFCSRKWPKIMSLNFVFRTNVRWWSISMNRGRGKRERENIAFWITMNHNMQMRFLLKLHNQQLSSFFLFLFLNRLICK